ncbi:MAG: hypothetical protein NC548_48785 [Lachnospiraceae bacterium]|nr:hypothetical protein [Lachnospiraceae bacterium]
MIKAFLALCAVAVAGAHALPVYASDIATESEKIGTFGDIDTSIDDDFSNFLNGMTDVLEDADEKYNEDIEENSESDSSGDSETPDSLGFGDFSQSSPSPVLSITPDDDVFFVENDENDIEPYSSYNVYYGSISSTYLEFMRGFLPKLKFNEHYVCARTSQYNYIFAFGSDLSWNGSFFTGFNLTVVTFNTYNNGSYSVGTESSFNLYPGSFMVYSDLSDFYPSLADTSGVSSRQILILLTIVCIVWTVDHMYNVRKSRRLK